MNLFARWLLTAAVIGSLGPLVADAKPTKKPGPAPVTAGSSPTLSSTTAWTIDDKVSQLDGSHTYTAILRSTNTMSNSIGESTTADLVVRCKEAELEVYIVWPPFIGSEAVTARWRFDQGAIESDSWDSSSDGTATFVSSPAAFVALLARSKRLVVEVPPYEQSTVEAVFALNGSDKVVQAVLAACPAQQ